MNRIPELGDEGPGGAGQVGPLAVGVVPGGVHDEAEDGADVRPQLAPAPAQPHNVRVGVATWDETNLNSNGY